MTRLDSRSLHLHLPLTFLFSVTCLCNNIKIQTHDAKISSQNCFNIFQLTLSLQTSEGYRNCIVWASQAHMYFTASEAIWRSPITKVTLPYVWEDMLGPLEPLKSLKFAIQRHLKMLGFYLI